MKDKCWMISRGGGGSPLSESRIVVRRTAAIGDCLSASMIADRLAALGHAVEFQCYPDFECVLKRQPNVAYTTAPRSHCHVNLDQTYEKDPDRRNKHFQQMWYEAAQQQLNSLGVNLGNPRNCKPRLIVTENERAAAKAVLENFPRPWVFICPRSAYYPARTVQDGTWQDIAQRIIGTKFWLGLHSPPPSGIQALGFTSLDMMIQRLAVADLLVTVDTGPMHIAAALGVPILALAQSSFPRWHLNDQTDFLEVMPSAKLDCLDCQKNVCQIPNRAQTPPCQEFDPETVAKAANWKTIKGTVSAIVPIYRPDAAILNKCLSLVAPQVDEVIVTVAADGFIPSGITPHNNVRFVTKQQSRIGVGRNINHGVRHSFGEWLMILNDDVFLEPDTVAKLMAATRPTVGIVCHTLRYADGTIYPVAMNRVPGGKDWFHIDYKAKVSSIKGPVELENCCGASMLVRRSAFYQANGFDERFFMYAEDNDLALRVRSKGWKIKFVPDIEAVHLQGQSSKHITDSVQSMINDSAKIFHENWGEYLVANRDKVPGDFAYLNR